MSFPFHDHNWVEAGEFVRRHLRPGETVIGPDLFWWLFERLRRYRDMWDRPQPDYHWLIIHKGEVDRWPIEKLLPLLERLPIVFANEVFVVFAARADLPAIDDSSVHVRALRERLADAIAQENGAPRARYEPVLPDAGEWVKFASLNDAQLAEAMDRFWTNGGYEYATVRDQVYYSELDRCLRETLSGIREAVVLDLCCGNGRLAGMAEHLQVFGVDISKVAVAQAVMRHATRPQFRFAVMNVHSLALRDDCFDVVLFVDAIEHVRDAAEVIREASRVLKPKGKLMLTFANRNSLNQVLTRKLGYPEFATNYQHVKEFTLAEIEAILQMHGLACVSTSGVFLFPYWGVPGVDQLVRETTDNDPEVVEMLRLLGQTAGARWAYTGVVLAEKRGRT